MMFELCFHVLLWCSLFVHYFSIYLWDYYKIIQEKVSSSCLLERYDAKFKHLNLLLYSITRLFHSCFTHKVLCSDNNIPWFDCINLEFCTQSVFIIANDARMRTVHKVKESFWQRERRKFKFYFKHFSKGVFILHPVYYFMFSANILRPIVKKMEWNVCVCAERVHALWCCLGYPV